MPIFPGIVGYDDTVVPQIVNAILSRHNFILLGLRGQAKSRILRALTTLLDPQMPYVAGCEIHDNPYAPICRRCRDEDCATRRRNADRLSHARRSLRGKTGHAGCDDRRPDRRHRSHQGGARRPRTVAANSPFTTDCCLAPIAASSPSTNCPISREKFRSACSTSCRKATCRLRDIPIRLPLDVALVFSANPEDYTARGKIITPLKDRIGSEIRTHYPATVEEGIAITAQEAWTQAQRARDCICRSTCRK